MLRTTLYLDNETSFLIILTPIDLVILFYFLIAQSDFPLPLWNLIWRVNHLLGDYTCILIHMIVEQLLLIFNLNFVHWGSISIKFFSVGRICLRPKVSIKWHIARYFLGDCKKEVSLPNKIFGDLVDYIYSQKLNWIEIDFKIATNKT